MTNQKVLKVAKRQSFSWYGVHAFIPTGLERVYVTILKAFERGDIETAAALFERVLPVLKYSNQHIDVSIRFFKELRKAEGLFDTSVCRTAKGGLVEIDSGQKLCQNCIKELRK